MPSKPKAGLGAAAKQRHTIDEGLARMAQSANPGEEQEMADITTPSMLELKTLILEGNKAITEKIDGVATTVALIQQNLDKMWEKVKGLVNRTNGLEENLTAHANRLTDHERCLQMQEAKLVDLEDRSQCNNICILGLPEGTETTLTEQFLESWKPTELLGLGGEEGLHVDRAHRTPGGKPKQGALLWMLIDRQLRKKDKLRILTAAHVQGNAAYNGNSISFYYGTATQKKWICFVEVEKKLQERGLAYSLLLLAWLRVDLG
ncbi:hypothetical protein NDU88_005307 [Pleurodeles waltl]|uniref:Uncharacterized protein n=1 Tax=Pleurodeles waltl TaxID=8319 RepID=A0AAV7NR74_PLEWA|nr:hypothetical protein NDU88_005307 [Pleurodeles waltl]